MSDKKKRTSKATKDLSNLANVALCLKSEIFQANRSKNYRKNFCSLKRKQDFEEKSTVEKRESPLKKNTPVYKSPASPPLEEDYGLIEANLSRNLYISTPQKAQESSKTLPRENNECTEGIFGSSIPLEHKISLIETKFDRNYLKSAPQNIQEVPKTALYNKFLESLTENLMKTDKKRLRSIEIKITFTKSYNHLTERIIDFLEFLKIKHERDP